MATTVLLGGTTTGPLIHNVNTVGWTLGGGIEGAVLDRWTAKAEYLYVDLGSTSFDINDGSPGIFGRRTITTDIQNHVYRIGVNYRLD